jgi:hypothetical protein
VVYAGGIRRSGAMQRIGVPWPSTARVATKVVFLKVTELKDVELVLPTGTDYEHRIASPRSCLRTLGTLGREQTAMPARTYKYAQLPNHLDLICESLMIYGFRAFAHPCERKSQLLYHPVSLRQILPELGSTDAEYFFERERRSAAR